MLLSCLSSSILVHFLQFWYSTTTVYAFIVPAEPLFSQCRLFYLLHFPAALVLSCSLGRKCSRIWQVLEVGFPGFSHLGKKRRKRMHHDIAASRRCAFMVAAASKGGRWSDDLVRLLRELATSRARSEPQLLRNSVRLAYLRRWWSLLSTALHMSIACALDPRIDSAFGVFPLADAIDIWARDPPEISSLGLRG